MFYPTDPERGDAGSGRAAESAASGTQDCHAFRYTVKEMVDTFGISRTNLLYYEKIGIVSPGRSEEASYRIYDEMDVFRLMSAMLLRNAGIPPKDLSRYLDDPYSFDHVLSYQRHAEWKVQYDQAMMDCIRVIGHMVLNVGTIETADVEPYCICWDNAEQGYHDFPSNENLGLLMAHVPLGSFGSYGDDPYVSEDVSIRWGRTVSMRNAALIPGLDLNMDIIGGYRCVCFIHFEPDLYAMTRPQEFARHDRERIAAYMDARGLRQVGRAFWPFTLPSGNGFFVMTCIPVGPLGMKEGEPSPRTNPDRSQRRWLS
ncbi:MAG: MerR family transcriptional regulator [Coriobacteriales bacterium]|jgi:DNA-binding transcriptional MerR regulator